MPVTLINAFEVPVSDETVFLEQWKRTSAQVQGQKGFIETKLHRALQDDARFLYVNVATWESEELYHAAFKVIDVHEGKKADVRANPALYKVVAQSNQDAVSE